MENKQKFSLNNTYVWFNDTIGESVKNSVSSFFENDYTISLTSINDFESLKDDPLLKGELFYTCRISIKNKQHITLRVTSDFIRIVFHDLFGSNYPVFDLEKLTELEQKILNGFFEHIVKGIDKFLIKESDTNKIDPLNKTNLNFVFLIKNKEINSGKLSVNIPLNRLEPVAAKLENNFEYDDFINNFAYVDLITGYAKISLNDLKNLDRDDILVLENSDIKTMTLKTPTITHTFRVNPEPSLMIDLDGEEGEEETYKEEYKEQTMPDNKSMWDDIQIEVSAEFKKVKMTLGELKQISKGLVIDLGAVMNNEISLLVENKAVAKGELVIINDKYGVKISEVFASGKKEEEKVPPQPPQAQAPAAPHPQHPHQAQAPVPPPQGARPAPPQRPMPPQRPQAPSGAQKPAAPQRPAPPQRPMPPQGARPAAPKAPPRGGNKEDFDYSNFEE